MISQNAAFLSMEQRGQMDNHVNFASFGFSSCLDSLNNNMLSSKNDLFIGQQLDEDWTTTLPTPPRSPESSQDEENGEDLKEQDLIELIGEAEALGLLENMELDFYPVVDDLVNLTSPGSWNPILGGPNNSNSLADPSQLGATSSELRHDCMWSGNCDDSCKQRIRYTSENSDIHLLTPASSPLRHCGSGTPPTADLKFSAEQSELEAVSVSAFVDPSAVLSYTPHSDHCYYQLNVRQDLEIAAELPGAQITVATAGPSPKKVSSWRPEQYVLSDTPSESDETDDSESNDDDDDDDDDDDEEDEEEIDVVNVKLESHTHNGSAAIGQLKLRAHQKSLTSLTTSSQRSLLKSKNSLKTAAHKQRKQKNAPVASVSVPNSPTVGPATPYLLPTLPSAQPGGNPAGPIEHPMPKVTSSGRVVQPTNRSVSFLEAQPQHSTRGEHHSRKRKKNSEHQSHSGRQAKHGRQSGSSRTCDVEDPEKRREHNSMERKRRDDLRFAFQRLRELVPELKDNPKAAKVTILSKAAEFSLRLQQQQSQLEIQASFEARRKRQLEKTFAALQQQHLRDSSCSSQSIRATALPV